MITLEFCPFTLRPLQGRNGHLRHFAWGWLMLSFYPRGINEFIDDVCEYGVRNHLVREAWSERPCHTLQ